jgi:hypothetical protein
MESAGLQISLDCGKNRRTVFCKQRKSRAPSPPCASPPSLKKSISFGTPAKRCSNQNNIKILKKFGTILFHQPLREPELQQ